VWQQSKLHGFLILRLLVPAFFHIWVRTSVLQEYILIKSCTLIPLVTPAGDFMSKLSVDNFAGSGIVKFLTEPTPIAVIG